MNLEYRRANKEDINEIIFYLKIFFKKKFIKKLLFISIF